MSPEPIEALTALEKQIRLVSRSLKARATADPVCRRLTSTPGVGPIIAFRYKSGIEDPGRFAHGEAVGA